MSQRHHLALSFALALCMGACACGGQAQKPASTPSSQPMGDEGMEGSPDADGAMGDDPHGEISRLFQQIGDSRRELGLVREPGSDDIEGAQSMSVPEIESAQASGSEPQSKSCKDICRISAAICHNADLICELAEELDGDLWANDKCGSAKASCMEASKRCSQCVSAE